MSLNIFEHFTSVLRNIFVHSIVTCFNGSIFQLLKSFLWLSYFRYGWVSYIVQIIFCSQFCSIFYISDASSANDKFQISSLKFLRDQEICRHDDECLTMCKDEAQNPDDVPGGRCVQFTGVLNAYCCCLDNTTNSCCLKNKHWYHCFLSVWSDGGLNFFFWADCQYLRWFLFLLSFLNFNGKSMFPSEVLKHRTPTLHGL